MKMTELLRYNVPPEVIRLWQEQESDILLPIQEIAIKSAGLLDNGLGRPASPDHDSSNGPNGGNLLIQAPTSSGKTFIGEMAAIQTALRRKKVIYLVPLKALAEEKHLDFLRKYAPYGIKTIISTRDHRQFDSDLESGDFSIAIVVYEKLDQLLVRRPERIEEIELIIADELEILSDNERGPLVELLLTRALRSNCRMIGMSAVVGEADKLAKWMNARLVHYDRRPVELRHGVLHEGVFKYRTYNEYSEGEERLVQSCAESSWEILMENLCAFVDAGEPCIVFVKAKHESRRGAELLGERLSLPPALNAMERLRRLEATHSRDKLLETLNSAVAFHNADLHPEERRIVEEGFRAGEIKALVSTSTLAMGLNMPAQNVFIASDKWQYDSRFAIPWKTPILRGEYENMGGRAGRYGSGKAFGRSILIAPTLFDHETLWRRYVEGDREAIRPQLADSPLEDHLLRLVASHACHTEKELQTFLEGTLTGSWIWECTLTPDEIEFRIRAGLNRALDAGMLAKTEDGRIEATPFGHATTSKGITIATANELAAWIRESEIRHWSSIDLLLAAALTPDGRAPQVSLTSREYDHADYLGQLKKMTMGEDLTTNVPLNRIRNCNLMPFFEEVRSIKTALMALDWIEEASIYDMEEKFRVFGGQIIAATEQLGWLLDATATIATAFGSQDSFVTQIQNLSERVQWGIRAHMLPLARLALPGLDRNGLLTLEAQGLHTPEAIVDMPVQQLARWTGRTTAQALETWARSKSTGKTTARISRASAQPKLALVIDDRRPGQLTLDGKAIQLQDKQYRLIRALAAAPGECVPYDTIYQAVWGETVVEPNQMHFQKRRLLDRIKEHVPERAEMVKTITKRGFVLDMAPHEVSLTASHAQPTGLASSRAAS